MKIETNRLLLRKLSVSDFSSLCKILQDETVMYAYEHAFDNQEVEEWYQKQNRRYIQDGFGLLAVIDKKSNKMIGQCGLTKQILHNEVIIEIGYLFHHSYWHQGYAVEASKKCIEYAFENFDTIAVYAIIRDMNIASKKVAKRIGMSFYTQIVKHYYGIDMPHDVYRITRDAYYKNS